MHKVIDRLTFCKALRHLIFFLYLHLEKFGLNEYWKQYLKYMITIQLKQGTYLKIINHLGTYLKKKKNIIELRMKLR